MIMEIKAEDFRQPRFDVISFLQYPQLHEESFSNLVLINALTRLMTACGIRDFTMQDVMQPEVKRTLHILSGLVNFAKFRENQVAKYQALVAETDQLNEAKQHAEDENARLQQQIDKIKAERQREQPQVDAIQGEVTQLTAEITEMNKTQATLKANIRKMKDETTSLVDEIASIALQAQTVEQDNMRLKSKIVQSPERMKRDMAELAHSLDVERENTAAIERKAQGLVLAAQTVEAAQTEVNKTMKMAEELSESLSRRKQAEQALEVAREGLQKATRQLQELTTQEQQLAHQLAMAQQRHQRLTQKQEMKRAAATQALEELRKDRGGVEEEAKAARARSAKIEAARGEQRQRQLRLRQAHDTEMAAMRAELRTLKEQVGYYDTAVVRACQEAW